MKLTRPSTEIGDFAVELDSDYRSQSANASIGWAHLDTVYCAQCYNNPCRSRRVLVYFDSIKTDLSFTIAAFWSCSMFEKNDIYERLVMDINFKDWMRGVDRE